MNIKNIGKNTIVSDNVLLLKTLQEKSDGLRLFEKPRAVFFETRGGIHTVGMKFAIDVVILDSENIVRKIKKELKPNSFFFWNPKYKKVLELPAGSVKRGDVEIGDILEGGL